MSSEIRIMREGFERVIHRLPAPTASQVPTFDANAIPEEANHQILTPKDTLLEPMVNDNTTRSSASQLISDRGPFYSEIAFDVSQTTLPANGLSRAASGISSGDDEVLKDRRLSRDNRRIKSCTHCRRHKVLSRSLLLSELKLIWLLDEM